MTTPIPYNLEAILAAVRSVPEPKEKQEPCAHWCQMEALKGRTFSGAMGYCTCQEVCRWEQCPMDVEAYVAPALPTFLREVAA